MTRRFAISDIHGCARTFRTLLRRIDFSRQDVLYLLGDYIDRGPDSRGVVEIIWGLQADGYQVSCLRGNHEQLLLNAVQRQTAESESFWFDNGGRATLASFRAEHPDELPVKLIDWINDLPYYLEWDRYLLVHAGLNFRAVDPLLDREAMLWERNWYESMDRQWLGPRRIVHGHTPTPASAIRYRLDRLPEVAALSIDAGCVFHQLSRHLGQLCALELNGREIFFQPNVEQDPSTS